MIKKQQQFFNMMQVATDVCALLLAYACAVLFKLKWGVFHNFGWKYIIAPLWMVPLLLLVYYLMGVYSPMRSHIYRKEIFLVLRAHIVGIIVIYSQLFLVKSLYYSREVSLLFAIFGILLLLLERYGIRRTVRHLRKSGYNLKHVLIIGAGPLGEEFADMIFKHRDFGYDVVGFLDDDETKHGSSVRGISVLGECALLQKLLECHAVDDVVVALPLYAYDNLENIINTCEKAGVRIRIILDYKKFLQGSPQIEEFDGIPLLNVRKLPLDDPFCKLVKRAFDIIVACIMILCFTPLMLCIAIGIKLTSPGPVFFRQQRIGLNNVPFTMIKFRTMHADDSATSATVWTTATDQRKTKFGELLRKTSLDELPQFFNVIAGNMSVIGPRPERPFFVEQFKEHIPKYMVKHQVKPGITGWAQVNGWRGNTSIAKRIEHDIYYIENWDILFDIKILLLTVFKGLINKNAY